MAKVIINITIKKKGGKCVAEFKDPKQIHTKLSNGKGKKRRRGEVEWRFTNDCNEEVDVYIEFTTKQPFHWLRRKWQKNLEPGETDEKKAAVRYARKEGHYFYNICVKKKSGKKECPKWTPLPGPDIEIEDG